MSKPKATVRKCKGCGLDFNTFVNTHVQYCKSCALKNRGERKEQKIKEEQVLKEPHICEECGKEYFVDFRKEIRSPSRFCSKSCCNRYSSSKRDLNARKVLPCKICGGDVEVKINAGARNTVCENCRDRIEQEKQEKRLHRVYKDETGVRIVSLTGRVSCRYCGRDITTPNIKSHERSCEKNPESYHIKHSRKRRECKEGYIYLITNMLNGKKYIGKKVGKPEESKRYMGSGITIKEAISKYGKENFTKTILEYLPNGNLDERESFWIKEYDTYHTGYNLTRGGDGGATNQGKNWYTDGVHNKLSCNPPEGFEKGITFHSSKYKN